MSLLEKLWDAKLLSIRKKATISPYFIEVVAMLERSLAMAYTGDARVITKDLMGPFGLKRSLLELGLPSITKLLTFDKNISQDFAHHPANWPLNKSNEPAVASRHAQTLTYGEDHWMVSFC